MAGELGSVGERRINGGPIPSFPVISRSLLVFSRSFPVFSMRFSTRFLSKNRVFELETRFWRQIERFVDSMSVFRLGCMTAC
jgi:hypothetical protein